MECTDSRCLYLFYGILIVVPPLSLHFLSTISPLPLYFRSGEIVGQRIFPVGDLVVSGILCSKPEHEELDIAYPP